MDSQILMDTFESLEVLFRNGASNSHFEVNEKVYFDNGYGASIVKGAGTFGYKQGLYELAIIDWNQNLVYDTDITEESGVCGRLTTDEVFEVIEQIKQLPFRAELKGQQRPENKSFGRYKEDFTKEQTDD